VHAVNFPGDPYPIHIDATFVPLRPGLIMNNPNRRLPDEQRKIFFANDWEIIDAAQPAHDTPPPLCYSSVWLSMNVLILDHKTVIAEASEVHQLEQLDQLGFEVLVVGYTALPETYFAKAIVKTTFRYRCRVPSYVQWRKLYKGQ